jgi:hypothetical protein
MEYKDFYLGKNCGAEDDLLCNRSKLFNRPHRLHCDCSTAICNFYLIELEYSQRKFNGRVWTDRHEEYYKKRITREALTILRFVLHASLGEARHALELADTDGYGDSRYGETQVKKTAYKLLRQLFRAIGIYHVPSDRNYVYANYIPEKLWWRLFKTSKDLFGFGTWVNGYGGVAWEKAIDLAMKAYKAVCLDKMDKTIIWIDTLINHCHNGGFLLNKFDCGDYNIKLILDRKSGGDIEFLEKKSVSKRCHGCRSIVPLSFGK